MNYFAAPDSGADRWTQHADFYTLYRHLHAFELELGSRVADRLRWWCGENEYGVGSAWHRLLCLEYLLRVEPAQPPEGQMSLFGAVS